MMVSKLREQQSALRAGTSGPTHAEPLPSHRTWQAEQGKVAPAEWRWCVSAAAAVAALATLPYLWLWAVAPPGMSFLGLLASLDDQCVYLAWMKQASEGRFFLRNLWTSDPQQGINVHLLFWLLGVVARFTTLSLPLVYHLGRVVLGIAVLLLFYRFAAFFAPGVATRRTCFGLAALSAGFGWLYQAPEFQGFVDWWQPEAITFQSLFANPLFCAGQALMLAVFCGLIAAERTEERRWAAMAGVAGGLLANIHSYDVFPVVGVWCAYLLLRAVVDRGLPRRLLADTSLAALIALPAVAYQFYVYYHEPVFRQRAALTITASPDWWRVVLGFGLLVPLGLAGALTLRRRGRQELMGVVLWLPVVWAVVGFAVPYLPLSWQRKMGMGLHLPWALLAGIGLMELARVLERRWPPATAARVRAAVVLTGVALTTPTNLIKVGHYVRNAMEKNLSGNETHPAFWPDSELQVLQWADTHLQGDPVVQALTITAAMIPPLTGARVWAGHWSETPAFLPRFNDVTTFFLQPLSLTEREQFLRSSGITHLFFGPRERYYDRARNGTSVIERQLRAAPFLRPLYSAGTGDQLATLYEYRPTKP